ncbi:nitrate regulatory gene2 protein [Vicia villosa]|uniref:nitrate regulatory gene2 protein n=1 Tax=Vicia villosa TaxID=3911 RepID=UPI00273AA539|nr:nitrate regulatory gene2 protein [Vicia villosa]
MGCNISKLDKLPAVSLCRDRSKFIDESLRQSYHLADAHLAHMESLRTLGPALVSFFQQSEDSGEIDASISKISSPLSSLFSSDSDAAQVLLHSDSETDEAERESQLCTHHFRHDYLHRDSVLSSVSDNYVKPIYDSYSPQPPSMIFSSLKPPSPPPPSNSAWDFLNFFEPYEKYQLPYYEGGDSYNDTNLRVEKEKGNVNLQKSESLKSKGGGDKVIIKPENKEGKHKETKLKEEKNSAELEECNDFAKRISETMKEIQILFEKASNSGNKILEMLDVGKLRYHSKTELGKVSWKIMHVFSQPNPVMNKCAEASLLGQKTGSDCKGVCKDKSLSHENLCSTLNKLCLWEKKLYHEVKAEEKMRTLHEKKCTQLKCMTKKDADAQKIESVEAFIDILVMKMKISFQVVDKISITTSKLTEEELWPHINKFILMFLRMWKDMQECYKLQYQKIVETKALDVSTFNRKPCNANIEAAIQLKSELQKWILSFLDWIQAQKSLVKSLNDWLVRCLMYEPEEILDDSATFDAPHVFVTCNKWSKAMDNISEKNVIEAVNGFIVRVNEPLEKYISEHQKSSSLDKELERKVKVVERQGLKMQRKVKIMERQEQKMHKLVQAREKKMAPIGKELKDETGAVNNNDDIVDSTGLQPGLKQIFVAMEKFSATNVSLYEELCRQIK